MTREENKRKTSYSMSTLPDFCMLKMMPYGMECPFSQLVPAVPAVSTLPAYSLLGWCGGQKRP